MVTAGLEEGPVTASRGVVLVPDTSLDEALQQEWDMVVLPGGLPGADHLNEDPRIADLLTRQAGAGRYTAAICAAPKVLADKGLLEGRRATCYPGVLEEIAGTGLTGAPVERDGTIITGRGPGTAMDFALALIEALEGREKRDEVEQQLVRS